jgi:hypothetical protein
MWIQDRNTNHVLGEAVGGGQGILRIKGPMRAELRRPISLRMPSSKGFILSKAQLLNILHLKSSSAHSLM